MAFHLINEYLNEVKVFSSDIYSDDRGFFSEIFRADAFKEFGLPEFFPQDNLSVSYKNVLRGLHFQWDKPMGKLLRVAKGSALFVEVDLRPDSPTFGSHVKIILDDESRQSLWTPPGFANGFLALSEIVEVNYKCTAIYNPKCEGSVVWNDEKLAIDWGIDCPILSEKDKNAKSFEYWSKRSELTLFNYELKSRN